MKTTSSATALTGTTAHPSLNVGVHGLGYVGTVTAACLAASGHRVDGFDVDRSKVEQLRRGEPPVVEPNLTDIVKRALTDGRLDAHCTTDTRGGRQHVDVHLVCVGTPSTATGEPDIAAVRTVVLELAERLKGRASEADRSATNSSQRFAVVVVRSTVLPGTIRQLASTIEDRFALRAGVDYGLAMCPEFLREGSAVADFFDPPFTVAGVSDTATAATLKQLFGFLGRPFHAVGYEEAELLKYACNTFHALKVTFANEIGRVAQASGADGSAVMDIFRQDDRLNVSDAYLRPGFAFGGSCLPKDLRALASHTRGLHLQLPVINSILRSNDAHLRWAFDLIQDHRPRQVAFLGITFKSDTDDLRESPFVALAEALIGKGVDVTIWDPILDPTRLRGANQRFADNQLPHLTALLQPSAADAVASADVCVVAASHPAVDRALAANPSTIVIDGQAALVPVQDGEGSPTEAQRPSHGGRQPVGLLS